MLKDKLKIHKHQYYIIVQPIEKEKCENGTICIFVKKVGGWKGQAMATSTTCMLSSS